MKTSRKEYQKIASNSYIFDVHLAVACNKFYTIYLRANISHRLWFFFANKLYLNSMLFIGMFYGTYNVMKCTRVNFSPTHESLNNQVGQTKRTNNTIIMGVPQESLQDAVFFCRLCII